MGRTSRNRAALTVGALAAMGLIADVPAAREEVTVGPNVQVSAAFGSMPHFEVLACADPRGNGRMLLGAMAYPEKGAPIVVHVYSSSNNGATWSHAFEASADAETRADPTCVFGPDGTAYQGMLGGPAGTSHMLLYRRAATGERWEGPLARPMVDRPYLAVRPGIAGRPEELLYVGQGRTSSVNPQSVIRLDDYTFDWTSNVSVMWSPDRGQSIFGPLSRTGFGQQYVSSMGNPVILRDGTLLAPFALYKDRLAQNQASYARRHIAGGAATLSVIRATPGAARLDAAVSVEDWYGAPQSGSEIPRLALDPGSDAFADRLYAVRIDTRTGRARPVVNVSRDGGRTWSRGHLVDDEAAGAPNTNPDASNPSIAVNAAGVVAVGWADRRHDPRKLSSVYRVAISLDGGETFLPSVAVASSPSRFNDGEVLPVTVDPRLGSDGRSGDELRARVILDSWYFDMGHTVDLIAAPDGRFHAFWVDNRTGTHQVWTAPIHVSGSARASTDSATARLSDVTTRVAMEFVSRDLDRNSNMVSLTIRFRNLSDSALTGPLRARLTTLESPRLAVILGAANQLPGAGAEWEVALPAGRRELAPGATTESIQLRFQLMRPSSFFGERGRGNIDLAQLGVRLFQVEPK